MRFAGFVNKEKRRKMERYTQYIIDILLSRKIPSFFNRDEMLVCSGYESEYGNIDSVYGFSDGIIRNVTIYDRLIRASDKEKIRAYLEDLNDGIAGGYFLTNPHMEYIVFISEYEVCHGNQPVPTLDIRAFCLRPHDLFTRYRSIFYQMTTLHKKTYDYEE